MNYYFSENWYAHSCTPSPCIENITEATIKMKLEEIKSAFHFLKCPNNSTHIMSMQLPCSKEKGKQKRELCIKAWVTVYFKEWGEMSKRLVICIICLIAILYSVLHENLSLSKVGFFPLSFAQALSPDRHRALGTRRAAGREWGGQYWVLSAPGGPPVPWILRRLSLSPWESLPPRGERARLLFLPATPPPRLRVSREAFVAPWPPSYL